MNGADYIIEFLQKHKAPVFGYPGANVLRLFDAMGRAGISPVPVRHEQAAAHAAAGYAKASGKPGICLATSGPGATNLVTGIADANLDSTPMLVLTGQVKTSAIGRDAFQEADIMGITIPISKHNYLVKNASSLASTLDEAWEIASSGRRGPVLVDIASDVFTEEIKDIKITPRRQRNASAQYALSPQLNDIKRAIEASHRPLILAGGGVSSAGADGALDAFAKMSGIPVATTMMGKSVFLPGAKNLGMAGVYGRYTATAALAQCDLVIASGVRFSDRTVADFAQFSGSRFIIHNDIDLAEINKNVDAGVAVVADAKEFFGALCNIGIDFDAKKRDCESWFDALEKIEKADDENKKNESFADAIIRAVSSHGRARGGIIYATDVGKAQVGAARLVAPTMPRGFVTSGGLGAMGFGLPGALGAAFAAKERGRADRVALFVGDGGFQMTMEELAGIKNSPVPIKIFLFDNASLGMIEDLQDELFGGRHFSAVLDDNPDFSLIAKAYGIEYETIEKQDKATLAEKVKTIFDKGETEIIHCKIV